MDLRVAKTKRDIRNAFLQLREKKELNKIKVVDICSSALINKTTFYKHYDDIYDLSEKLENEMFSAFWADFAAKDCLLSDPHSFITSLPRVMDERHELLPLFRGRYNHFFELLEDELMARYLTNDMKREDIIRLRFLVHGLVAMLKDVKQGQKITPEEISEVFNSLIN